MVTQHRDTYPSSENFNNDKTPPDGDPQAVVGRPPETESTPHPIHPASSEIVGSLDEAPPVIPPYDGRLTGPYSMPGSEEVTTREIEQMRRHSLYPENVAGTVKKRNKAVIGLIGTTGVLAAIAGAYFVGQARDTAKALEDYPGGLPPSPPAATALEIPGDATSKSGELRKDMSLTERQAFLHTYAKEHLSQDDLNRFEGIAAITVSGNEFAIPGSNRERSKEALLWYDSIVLKAIGDQVAADHNAKAKEYGYPQIGPASIDAFKNGFDPSKTPDPKMLMDVFQLKIAAATSLYVTFADGIKILNGASSARDVNNGTAQLMRDTDEIFVSKTADVHASQVFEWDDPHILALGPGIYYKEGAPIMVVQFQNTDRAEGSEKTTPLQETFRLETYQDPETGATRMTPVTQSQYKGGRVLDGGSISFITDLSIFSR